MSTHKGARYRNIIHGHSIIHLGANQNVGATPGFVSEYDSSGTKYTGIARSGGSYHLFDGLTDNPFALDGQGVPQDIVNTSGTGFTYSALSVGAVTSNGLISTTGAIQASSNITSSGGYVQAGNLRLTGNDLISTNTNGSVQILPNGTGSIVLGAVGNPVLLPADPSAALGAATKQYVDSVSQGFSAKQEVRVRTTSDLADLASGGISVAGSGSTHTITRGQNGAISGDSAAFDGVSLILNDRVLVMLQGSGTGSGADNGIYTVTSAGSGGSPWVLTRAVDFNSSDDVVSGAYTFANQGTVWASTGWVMSTANPITLETTSLTFVQFSQVGAVSGNQLNPAGYNVFRDKIGSLLNFRALNFTNAATNTSAVVETTQNTTDITFNFDSTKIVSVGALASGSIASGFGTISTANSITTTSTITGGTLETTSSLFSVTAGVATFGATTGNNKISIGSNLADALNITQGATSFLKFVTTSGSQSADFGRNVNFNTGAVAFTAASGSNTITVPANAANALNITDGSTNIAQVVTSTGNLAFQVNSLTSAAGGLTVTGDTYHNGGYKEKVSALSSATTLSSTHNIVNVTTGASNIAITLPDATAHSGRHYKVSKADNGAGNVVITPASGDYLDGVQNDTLSLVLKDDHAWVVSHGAAGWYIY